MVKQWQDLFYEKRRSHTSLGEVPDFVKYAKSFNAGGIRIEKTSEIADAFKEALGADIPYVLDFHIDPDEHVLPMMLPGGKPHEMIDR